MTINVEKVRKKILNMLWEAGRPMKPQELAEKMGLSNPSLIMHLIWLAKAGYVSTPKKGFYTVTDQSKKAIGLPKIDEEQASAILTSVPSNQGFYFYNGLGEYTGVYAGSLDDFAEKLRTVGLRSLEFHVSRGDFEAWLSGLGDAELVKRIGLIRKSGLSGEPLQRKLCEMVQRRCEELKSLSRGARKAYVVFRKA